MKRIVFIIIAVLVLAIGGWSAFWFMNRATAEQKMREALATLERAGTPNSYDAITISGFPFSYRGEVVNLRLGDGQQGGQAVLPTVAAEINVAAPDTVVFTLPQSFRVAPAGVAPEQGVEIVSETLQASVRLVEEGAFDLKLSADALAARLPNGVSPVAFEGLSGAGALNIDEDDATLTLNLSALKATQSLPPMQPLAPEAGAPDAALTQTATRSTLSDLSIDIDGSLKRVGAKAKATSLLVEFDHGGVVELTAPSYEVEAAPKERFDPSFLSGVEDFDTALGAFARMAGHGVARGGQARTALAIEAAKGSGMIEGEPAKMELSMLALTFDLGAKRVGMTISGDKVLADATLPGGESVYYDGSSLKAEYYATPAEAFDFSTAADVIEAGGDPSGDLVGQAIVSAIGEQIMLGGAVEMRASAGPSVTRAPTEPGVAPFRQIESRVGASDFRLALNPDEAVLKTMVDGLDYKVSNGFEGGGSVSALNIDIAAPLRAASQEQTATMRATLGEVKLDDTVWDLIDPEEALNRSIAGLTFSADANVLIRRDLLSPEANVMDMSDPALVPGEITINDSFAEALGLRTDLSGALSLTPLPQGALNLTVTGWKAFLAAIQQTPIGKDPQNQASLASLDDIWTRYRDPAAAGAEDQAQFAIEIGSAGLMVNGEPFEPGPAPADQTPGGAGEPGAEEPSVEPAPAQ